MSLPITEIIETLGRFKIDSKTILEIRKDLENKECEIKDERATSPKTKNQFVVIVVDPENQIQKDVTSLVVQIPENEDAGTALSRLHDAIYAFNRSKKRRGNVTKLQDIGNVKRHFLKEKSIHVKTKELVRVIPTNGELPLRP